MSDRRATRRAFLGRCLAGGSLAALLADRQRVLAAASTLETVRLAVPGGREVSASLAIPAGTAVAPFILLIHEWWGLNDQIRSVGAVLAEEGYGALAVDLYHGRSTTDRAEAMALRNAVDTDAASETLAAWLDWLKTHPRANGKLATLGWCFGGGWSLNASLLRPVDGTVVYYGRVDRPAEQLRRLKGPVLGHFARRDQAITPDIVERFEAAMREADRRYVLYWYDADHAFANPTDGRYDAEDAQLAWTRTLAFFGETLRG